jgi:flagellar protein FliO/FliZ
VIGAAAPAAAVSVSSALQLTLSLAAVVGLIFAITWVLKRFKIAGPRGSGGIAVIDELTVGPRTRIVLVRVGESQVLVGVGANGLVALTPLAMPIVMAPAAAAPVFADRLREFMQRPGGSK